MPHQAPRQGGPRIRNRQPRIKQDPEPMSVANTVNFSMDESYDDQQIPVNQSFVRNERSDAPPPSERTEPEPLLREVRTRTNISAAAAESPRSMEESFFHTSFQDIGKKLKECNDTLGELQQLGVSHDVQLPELVLVGDQSAGKSSLMSGLANLDLPRSEGTCTRCPLHIRVSRNSEWSCRVWLRKEYSYKPPNRPISEADVTEQDPFFPWRKRPNSTVLEFKSMHDKSEIEGVLRWAQIAILNDDKHHAIFVPGSGAVALSTPISEAAETTLAKFSPNVVALEIKGPDLPDLSFYDMPGIFQNPADANDEYLVNVVRNLSSAYIQHPSAIIICSMPMNSDAELSATFGLARKLGAKPRTIGVLTKADILPDGGNHSQWLDIMKGCAHTTGLGYFITSRPQGKDLEELKKWEERFFEDDAVDKWPPAFHQFRDRCGVEKLKAFLSERLGEEFAKSLPNIKSKVKLHLDKITKQLQNLPELPKNVELEIQTCLTNFADKARQRIDDYATHFNTLPNDFRNCLLEIKPKFILKDRSDVQPVELSDDDESDAASVAASVAATPSKRRQNGVQATPSKRLRLDQVANGATPSAVKHEDSFPAPGASPRPTARRPDLPEPFREFGEIGRSFRTLRQVKEEIQNKMNAGMPNIIPPEVYNDLAMEAISPWKKPTEIYLSQVVHELHSELGKALDASLEPLKKRLIYSEAKRHLKSCMDEHWTATIQALIELYEDETAKVLTYNIDAFNQCIKIERDVLTRFRHHMRMIGAGFKQNPLLPWESLTEEKQMQDMKRRELEQTRLKPDEFEREVEVVAYVRGYYRLAALRYSDAVSQRIICRMIPALRRQLRNYLDEKLNVHGVDSMEVYEKLMKEDDATAAKRNTLKMEHGKFLQAMTSIESLETGTISDVASVIEGSMSQSMVMPRRESDVTMEDEPHSEEV